MTWGMTCGGVICGCLYILSAECGADHPLYGAVWPQRLCPCLTARTTNSSLNSHHQWALHRLRWLPRPRWFPHPRYPNLEDTLNAWFQIFLRLLMTPSHSVQTTKAALVSLPTAHHF